ncbi:MAG: GNAT family N-acetyltransferase [Bryobacterales bacterium]|nr:GNAT family N-acetyltransferase [Bryobacterales bacterium]
MLIRALRPGDIPQAMRLKEAAGWNQTEEDWLNLIELEPEGCFALELEGRLVSTTTVICYGQDLAWIGMVLTDPEYRGRGFARRLMEHALAWLRARQIRWIKLDATDMGRPLYLSLGFQDEDIVERWAVAPRAPTAEPEGIFPFDLDEQLDREAFGADRRAVLARLARWETASLPGCAYAMGRPGSNAFYFGPCVSRSPLAARRLLEAFLARHAGETVFWDLLPANRAAVELARAFGFEPQRRLVRMVRRGTGQGPPVTHSHELIYGIAGFEFG